MDAISVLSCYGADFDTLALPDNAPKLSTHAVLHRINGEPVVVFPAIYMMVPLTPAAQKMYTNRAGYKDPYKEFYHVLRMFLRQQAHRH